MPSTLSQHRRRLFFAILALFLLLFLFLLFYFPRQISAAALSDPSIKGKVIDLGDGRPWLVVQSTDQTGSKAGFVYIMAMYNYGNTRWGLSDSNPATAISATSDTGSFYSSLPSTIGGFAKSAALASHTWQWDSCSLYGGCSNTTTSTSRLSFVSFREWQGTTTSPYSESSSGSVGNLFCQAWKGTPCLGSYLYSAFNYPWTRSGHSGSPSNAWFLFGEPATLLNANYVADNYGTLLAAWLSVDLCTNAGSGTFASPYTLSSCNSPPTLTITNPSGNPWQSAVSGYTNITVSGTVTDPDSNTQAIQYSIDGGTWTAGQNLVAGSGTRTYSFSVNVGSLAAGSHNIKTRTYDGTAYSGETGALSFRLDKTSPTCAVSGGNTAWTNGNRTITGTCADTNGSGCSGTNPSYTFSVNTNTTTAGPGTNGTAGSVSDAAGNTAVCAANQTVRIDKTAPTCTSSGGNSSWTNATRTLTGTCSDTGGSGCSSTTITKTYSANINSTTESPGSVSDTAGNTATCPSNQTVRIDMTSPTCTTSGGSPDWTNGNRTIIGTCADTGGSGCSGSNPSYTFSVNTNTTTAGPGTNGAAGLVSDAAGNIATCLANQTVRIDKTNPTFTLSPSPTGINSWTTSTSLTITPTDTGGAGVAETRYATTNVLNSTCTSGGSVYAASITLNSGTNNIYVCTRDNAGNVSTSITTPHVSNVYQVNRDSIQPPPDPNLENSVANIGAFASYVSGYSNLTLAGTTHDSDVGQTLTLQYQIDNTNGSWYNLTSLIADGNNQSWSSTIDIATHYPGLAAGVHTIYVRVYDGYSYSANKSMQFTLDSTAPTNTATLLGGAKCAANNTIYCSPPTTIDLSSSTDAAAGIGSYRTQWTSFSSTAPSPSWIEGIPSAAIPTSGHTTPAQTHTLYYQTRDKVGHVSSVDSISYYINSPPTIFLDSATLDHVITPFNSLIFTGHFTDLDLSQTVSVKATINSIDYSSPLFTTNGHQISFHLIIPFSALASLAPSDLTNLPLTVTDSAGSSATTYYTGQITTLATPTSEIYLSVIKNTPFSLVIGRASAFNLAYGTHNGITVSQNVNSEVIVSGQLSASTSVTFGATTLVFTALDAPATTTQQIEFI